MLEAEAVLNCVGRTNMLIELDEVRRERAEVRVWGQRKRRILNLYRVKDYAVVKFDGGGKVAARAVVEDSGSCTDDGFAFAGCVGERDAGREVVVVRDKGLPVVTKSKGELQFRSEL